MIGHGCTRIRLFDHKSAKVSTQPGWPGSQSVIEASRQAEQLQRQATFFLGSVAILLRSTIQSFLVLRYIHFSFQNLILSLPVLRFRPHTAQPTQSRISGIIIQVDSSTTVHHIPGKFKTSRTPEKPLKLLLLFHLTLTIRLHLILTAISQPIPGRHGWLIRHLLWGQHSQLPIQTH